jgi:hypothetical protein
MAQTGFTPISNYYSATASNVPTAGNLVAGELAINTADGKLFYKDSSGVVQTIATKASAALGTSTTGSGATVLQTSPTITTPVIDKITTSVANTSLGAGNASIMKNRLINGDMRISQRNGTSVVTPTTSADGYPVDRFNVAVSQNSKLTCQQSTTAPAGFVNSSLITSSSAYSVASGDVFMIRQQIEGSNISDLAWGTASAKTVTLSFWVQSSLTGAFGGALQNSAGNRCYPFTYSISAANTWEQKSVTIAGDTSGTWLTTPGIGITLLFGLGVGSTYSGTAGAWTASAIYAPTGATSVVGTNGATFYITGVQLEVGSSATGFEYRMYGTELANCQRYYEVCSATYLQAAAGASLVNVVTGQYRVTKRATPTLTLTQVTGSGGGQFSNTIDNWSASAYPDANIRIGWSATSSAEL